MFNALVFLLLAVACLIQSIRLAGWAWLLLWPAAAFGFLAMVYAVGGVGWFGKRPDGTIHPFRGLPSLPARLILTAVRHMRNLFLRSKPYDEIAPGLFLGQRPFRVPTGISCVIDLAGEFSASSGVRACESYRSVPLLDRSIGNDQALIEVARSIALDQRPTLIHCAQGYGRSAQLMAAVLVTRGDVLSIDAALDLIRSRRPGIRPTRSQIAQLRRYETRLSTIAPSANNAGELTNTRSPPL